MKQIVYDTTKVNIPNLFRDWKTTRGYIYIEGEREKEREGGHGNFMDIEKISKKYHLEIPGVNWKRNGISKIDQKNILLNFHTKCLHFWF